jgi:hypothetical protein
MARPPHHPCLAVSDGLGDVDTERGVLAQTTRAPAVLTRSRTPRAARGNRQMTLPPELHHRLVPPTTDTVWR